MCDYVPPHINSPCSVRQLLLFEFIETEGSQNRTGRFKPEEGANPKIGSVGNLEEVSENRIETVCSGDKLHNVLKAIREVHPYEEPATDVYPIEIV